MIADKFDIKSQVSRVVKISQLIGAVFGSLDFIVCSIIALFLFEESESTFGYFAAFLIAGWGVLVLVSNISELSKKESYKTTNGAGEELGAEREI